MDYGYEYEVVGAGASLAVSLIWLLVAVVMIAAMWKIFAKAGQPGWAAIVPIYNVVVLLQVVGRPVWWVLLYLVPLVNVVISIIVAIDLARVFGKGAGFGLGIAFLPVIFYPVLAFGNAGYRSAVAPAV